MVFTKKSKLSPLHKGMLIGAGAVALFATVVSAVGKRAVTQVGINEVCDAGTVEKTITGMVTREKIEPSGKERYVITAEGGVKYALIGLKQAYDTEDKTKEDEVKNKDNKGKNSPKPSMSPKPKLDASKVDREDINSFEAYVGKKVTITGFVVPVENKVAQNNDDKGNKPSMSPKAKDNNGKKPSPKASAKASPSPKDSGWDYARFVVKSVKIVQ